MSASIVWFRQDLRLRDNPALHAASRAGAAVIPLYIWSPAEEGNWAPGSASRWWLHNSLIALNAALRERGSRLILAAGRTVDVLRAIARDTGATAIYWNARFEPAAALCSRGVSAELNRDGVRTLEFNGSLLSDPREFLNQSGRPYQVYSAFRRALLHSLDPGTPLPLPRALPRPRQWPKAPLLDSLGLLPRIPWYGGLAAMWRPGEDGARARLDRFLQSALSEYGDARNLPAIRGTSGLSPHLHFGEIGPRQIWHALGARGRASAFLGEVVWREFAHHLLHHFPDTPSQPLRPEFARFPWRDDAQLRHAWERGITGIPLVDAGMRELWQTGWMHNRVRMVVASFLVKNLQIRWQHGARWFWDTLVDADLANNTLNWQWVAGCGADAAPYFRIFNPLTQAKKFDPQGTYVGRYVPESQSGDGRSYPSPIVDLSQTREAALDAYRGLRAANAAATRLS